MPLSIKPHLMFEGVAEAAMQFYVSVFSDAEILHIERYKAGELGPEGSVKLAHFKVSGQEFLCIDSPVKHNFTFTPSISLFVECQNEAELTEVFQRLSEQGNILMPLANYGFSQQFGWVQDRFGVSWQLNLQ